MTTKDNIGKMQKIESYAAYVKKYIPYGIFLCYGHSCTLTKHVLLKKNNHYHAMQKIICIHHNRNITVITAIGVLGMQILGRLKTKVRG